MTGRPLVELLEALENAVAEDAARKNRDREASSTRLAGCLSLVHRTGRKNAPAVWHLIFEQRRMQANEPESSRERAIGFERIVYFALGCATLPEGIAALLLAPSLAVRQRSTFTPFDTGGLDEHLLPASVPAGSTWDDEPAKERTLASFLGCGGDAAAFAGRYIASHFQRPIDYVLRPQRSSPDWSPYHGLRSTTGDRRAWTIEVQIHGDVDVLPDPAHLHAVVLGDEDLLSNVPDEFVRFVKVAETEDEVAVAVADEIVRRASGGAEG